MFTIEKIKKQSNEFQEEVEEMCDSPQQYIFQNDASLLSFHTAKKRFIEFVQDLGEFQSSEIRSDVLIHCEQINRNRKIISHFNSHETILKLISSRIEKMFKNKKIKKNWSEEDLKILVWIVSKYAEKHDIANIEKEFTYHDWSIVASLIPGVSLSNCMYKWLSLKKVNLSTKNWAQEESSLLNKMIYEHFSRIPELNILTGCNWRQISQRLYDENKNKNKVYRSPKQCKEHWNCFLNPTLKKGPWQLEQDILLLSLIKKNNGLKRWSEIVQFFSGRTQNALKNRYNLLLDKQKKLHKNKSQMSLLTNSLQSYYAMNAANQDKPIPQQVQNIKPIIEEQNMLKMQNTRGDLYEQAENSENKKSESNQIEQRSCSTPSQQFNTSGISTKIRFLSSFEQSDFLSWIKERTDVKKCCLKNGTFQIQQ